MEAKKTLQLIPDIPAWEVDDSSFGVYRDVLCQAIRGTQPPFTLGIFGQWGGGKTTLLKMMFDQLDEEGELPAIWFNAWRFQKEDHIILPLLETIRLNLHGNDAGWVKQVAGNIGTVMSALVSGFSASLSGGIGQINWDPVKTLDTARRLKEEVGGVSLYFDALHYLDQAISELRKEDPRRRIVVFVDDLDRCLPEKALELLEGIKTFLDIDGFVFVLALDRQVIDEFVVREKYKWMGDAVGQSIKEPGPYVAKLIQLPFDLPPMEPEEVRKYAVQLLPPMDGVEDEVQKLLAEAVVAGVPPNRRMIKRLINAFRLRNAIQENLGQPLDPVATLILLALNLRWVRMYEEISRGHRDFLDRISEYLRKQSRGDTDNDVPFPALESDEDLRVFLSPDGPAAVIFRMEESLLVEHLHATNRVGAEVAREGLGQRQSLSRIETLERLALGGKEAALPEILQTLRHDNPDEVAAAAGLIGRYHDEWDLSADLSGQREVLQILRTQMPGIEQITRSSGLAMLLSTLLPMDHDMMSQLVLGLGRWSGESKEIQDAIRSYVSRGETHAIAVESLRIGLASEDSGVIGRSASLLLDAGEKPDRSIMDSLTESFRAFEDDLDRRSIDLFVHYLGDKEHRDIAIAALRGGFGRGYSRDGRSAILLLENGEAPDAQYITALARSFLFPNSWLAQRAEEFLTKFAADAATREIVVDGLKAALQDDDEDEDVIGISAAILLDIGEIADPLIINALLMQFDERFTHRTSTHISHLLADSMVGEITKEVLQMAVNNPYRDGADGSGPYTGYHRGRAALFLLQDGAEFTEHIAASLTKLFFFPDGEFAGEGKRLFSQFINDSDYVEMAIKALKLGSESDDSNIAKKCADLLSSAPQALNRT